MKKQRIRDVQSTVIEFTDGTKDQFEDVLADNCAGTEEILDTHYQDILQLALNSNEEDYLEIEGVVAPVIGEIVKYAFFNNWKIFEEILQFMFEIHSELVKSPRDYEIEINKETVDLFAVIEDTFGRLSDGWSVKEFTANDFADYKIILSKGGVNQCLTKPTPSVPSSYNSKQS